MIGPVCFDLDDTITRAPEFYRQVMWALRSCGHKVHVLSGTHHAPATPEDLTAKAELLRSLGCASCYDELVAVSGPEDKVPENKVAYMRSVGASALIDNDKANVKAAQKAGFLALRHRSPKG
jgi:hypothetical protein